MSGRNPVPLVLAAGGALGLGYLFMSRGPMKTTGSENIEARYTAGGGAPNHQPGTATKLGDSSNTSTRHTNNDQGPDSKKFDESINEQKTGDSGIFPKKFYEGQLGNPKGK